MIAYPNREHKNADEAARRRAAQILVRIEDEASALRIRIMKQAGVLDGDDSQVLSALVRDLTQHLSILGTLREVREWDAADRAEQAERLQPVRAPEGIVAECGYCTTRITVIDGQWTADDGTIACTDTSAPFVPHKPEEDS